MKLTKILATLLIVLALGLAVVAWMLGREPGRPKAAAPAVSSAQPEPQAAPPVPTYAVVVAARPIAAGQRLAPEDVKQVQRPEAQADGFAATADVLGHTTLVTLAPEAPLLQQQLVNGLTLQLEPGQRAVSIAVKEPMAAGHHVRPGDFVDVFFTLDGKNDQATVDTQTRLLLARSRVLAYGPASVENPPPTAAQRKAQQEKQDKDSRSGGSRDDAGQRNTGNINTAVLAVPLEDVERLTLAEKYGQLTLALRHPDDTALPDTALFAALPTALQPVAGRLAKGERLQGADRAFAGLRFKDLAVGADAKTGRRPTTHAAPGHPQPPRQQTVELFQGVAPVQQVRY
ncbi:Flp pilus assembly protein CpaB [Alicycliphilus sp. T452]